MSLFGLFQPKPSLQNRLGQLEDELARVRRHLADLEDTLSHRIAKLMKRTVREDESPPADGGEPLGVSAPPQPIGYPSLAHLKRRMRGF